jgi:hypothetical protein
MADDPGPARSATLLRVSAPAAIAGGALRTANSFTTNLLSTATLDQLYLVTDVLLLAGIAGVWWRRRQSLGPAAHTGVAIFVVGTLAIRVSALGVLGVAGYQIGAAIALVGLAAYSVETVIRRGASLCPPVLWLVSLACAIVGALGVAPHILIGAAGVTFGAGFILAGVEVLKAGPLRSCRPRPGDR